MKLVLTCEHGGNDIPDNYNKQFNNKAVLKTHRAYDLGTLDVFQYLKPLSDASFYNTTSRLLVELNRSLHHKNLFSEFTKNVSKDEKTKILKQYYLPYRIAVENNIKSYTENGETVLHLSIHSFTPIFNGEERHCDIGLLYDSTKKQEQQYCKQLKTDLLKQDSNLNVRFNYPYLGKADGFTTYLRKQFPNNYLGVEIELNQKFAKQNSMDSKLKQTVYNALDY
ncbi:N-formylglutamate amidohydrolase [Winogradskyella eximia]|jgi:predicted N-formylglutamate amidohydrolase|uniref:N-formylglutamate amidohydrolase n=1 Tax=Winogradskyella eximia TaxID=262006 RepID=UPI00249016D8|nr:N-formylglutamate amidohydrolase [Winogradskyella eximia]